MRNDRDRPATATSRMRAISSLVFRSIRDIVNDQRGRTAADVDLVWRRGHVVS
jgi:hypothetical protein